MESIPTMQIDVLLNYEIIMCIYMHWYAISYNNDNGAILSIYSYKALPEMRMWKLFLSPMLLEFVTHPSSFSSPDPTCRNLKNVEMMRSVTARWHPSYYWDVIMGAMSYKITSLTSVYSTVYTGADKINHQSFASLAIVLGIHRWPVNSPHKWPVTQKTVSIWWRHPD